MRARAQALQLANQLCPFLAVWPQASYLSTQGFSFSIYIKGVLVIALSHE